MGGAGPQARVAKQADAEGLNPSGPVGAVRVRTPPRARLTGGVVEVRKTPPIQASTVRT